MTQEERDALSKEWDELTLKMKAAAFINPKDMRRKEAITSLLITDGKSECVKLVAGKPRQSNRVTSFTRDRR